jgi:hypothetical protein
MADEIKHGQDSLSIFFFPFSSGSWYKIIVILTIWKIV